jgi:hypothetical protein
MSPTLCSFGVPAEQSQDVAFQTVQRHCSPPDRSPGNSGIPADPREELHSPPFVQGSRVTDILALGDLLLSDQRRYLIERDAYPARWTISPRSSSL